MTYKTIFGEEFENEFDEKMTHKYGDKYKCVKSVYPDVCKLPESEIQPMTYIARYQGDTVDEAKDLVRKYIKEKEPMWNRKYFCVKGDYNFEEDQNVSDQNELEKIADLDLEAAKFRTDYADKKQKTYDEVLKNMELSINRKKLEDALYNHLKRDYIEGSYNQAYCDKAGIPTVGVGLNMLNRNFMSDMTVTPHQGPISETNQPFTPQQKSEYMNRLKEHCASYYIGKDKNGKNKYKVPLAQETIDEYQVNHGEPPYFQDAELEQKSKNYIRNSVIPVLEKKISNLGKDLYKDFNINGRIGEADMLYTLGENKFRLNPDGETPEDWPSHAKALRDGNALEAAKQSHRMGVGSKRNDDIYGKISHGMIPMNFDYPLNIKGTEYPANTAVESMDFDYSINGMLRNQW